MRRTVLIVTIAALSLAACGSSDSESEPATSEGAEGTESTDVSESEELPPDTTPAAPAENPDKPEVDFPGEAPTVLVRNVLVEGTGEPAVEGDTVIVDYVGVRSTDGVEFDNSYDRDPFPVTLGNGSVIQGWEDGLVGAKTGERVQLDIPSDLAYGETARSEVIGENESLTFVIDVRAVVGGVEPADAPTEPGVPLSTGDGVEATEFEDLVVGEGTTLEPVSYTHLRAHET